MKKKNSGLIIFLVIIILLLGGFIIYDKNFLGLKSENGDTSSDISSSTNKVDTNIKIGSVGNNEGKAVFNIDKDAYFYIKDGKVVFHKADGTEVVDSTIPDKVIQVALGESCNGYDKRLAALTENGDVYYNKYYNLESVGTNDYNYKFEFIKVVAEGKVYGIESISPNVFQTCGFSSLFAYVDSANKRVINTNIDYDNSTTPDNRVVYSASLGKTYNELYPYDKYYIIFNLDGPVLYKLNDGKLYFERQSGIANADTYLTIDGSYIYADSIYLYKSTDDNTDIRTIIDKDKKVYLLTITKKENYGFKFSYSVENTGKVVKEIKEQSNNDGATTYLLEYTDGSSEKVF